MARTRPAQRDRRLIVVCVTIALAAVGALGLRMAHAEGPAPDVVSLTVPPQADGTLDLVFTGDTMLGDGAQPLLDTAGFDAPFAQVKELLDGEVNVVNAEGPITTVTQPLNPGQKFSYGSDPAVAAALARAGVTVLALGNNHAMDRGGAGLQDTIGRARAAGLVTFGAGANRSEAARPLLVTSGESVVALVSFGEDFGPLMRSTETGPGMVPLRIDRIVAAHDTARAAGAQHVIAVVHWGDNYADVNAQQRYWADQLVVAGFDAVIGSGAHVVQPVELVRGKPVVYSLGNFVFGAPGRFDSFAKAGLGLVAGLRWDAAGRGTLSLRCIETDNNVVAYVPRPCGPVASVAAIVGVGKGVTWSDRVGRVSFQ